MLAQTMRRRILLTTGSEVLSTTVPAGLVGVFAVAGNGVFGEDDSPEETVSPDRGTLAVLSGRSGLSGLSTM